MFTEVPVAPLIVVPLSDHAIVIGSAVLVVMLYDFVLPSLAVVGPVMVTVGVAGDIATERLPVALADGYPVGYT